ncbi:CAP domain-containing protein [Patescibacteria group bacterium]|nr:CAP domain-containing protein [Patescibacteria group bacterium]
MKNKNKVKIDSRLRGNDGWGIARTTVKVVVLAYFFSIALIGGAAPAFANDLIGQEATIIGRTNQVRAEIGLPALNTDGRLMRSAAAKAADMATKGYFAHADANGNRMGYWISPQSYVYSLAGENIAKGYNDINRLMNAWIASPTHYKNLTEIKFTDIGVGMALGWYENRETLFIVQHFGVEATQTVKEISQITSVATSVVEKVAGAFESTSVDTPAQSKPLISVINDLSTGADLGLPEPPAIETAQILIPPSTGGTATSVVWPLWAILILAAMGYIMDERFILILRERLVQYRK